MLTLAADSSNASPRFARHDRVLDKDCQDLLGAPPQLPAGTFTDLDENVEFSELSQASECRRPGDLRRHLDEACVEHGLFEREVDEFGLLPRVSPPEPETGSARVGQ